MPGLGRAALAVAARQLGEDAIAEELARAVAPPPLPWHGPRYRSELLATGRLGVRSLRGDDARTKSTVGIDGWSKTPRPAHAQGGAAAAHYPSARCPGYGCQLRFLCYSGSQRTFASRPVPRTPRPLSLRIDGHVGHASETAALELTVEGLGQTDLSPDRCSSSSFLALASCPMKRAPAWPRRPGSSASRGTRPLRESSASTLPRSIRKSRSRLPLPIYWLGSRVG